MSSALPYVFRSIFSQQLQTRLLGAFLCAGIRNQFYCLENFLFLGAPDNAGALAIAMHIMNHLGFQRLTQQLPMLTGSANIVVFQEVMH